MPCLNRDISFALFLIKETFRLVYELKNFRGPYTVLYTQKCCYGLRELLLYFGSQEWKQLHWAIPMSHCAIICDLQHSLLKDFAAGLCVPLTTDQSEVNLHLKESLCILHSSLTTGVK